jgi:hypothetical protein
MTKKNVAFWLIYGLLLSGVTLLGLEAIASFFVPPWPSRILRPIVLDTGADASSYNSWGMRDRERSIVRPRGIRLRSVFVGDSFLEGGYTHAPLPARIEARLAAAGHNDIEAINLGVSATGPRQYYYRIKRVALKLEPDVVLMMFYSGNDFIHERLGDRLLPPLIDELPEPSLLGEVAPRLTWLAVNRLRLSEAGRASKPIPGESTMLNGLIDKPLAERLNLLIQHMKKYYFPGVSERTLREILSRGGENFWSAFERSGDDRQYLAGWVLDGMITWELANWQTPRDSTEADRNVDMQEVNAALSWIVGAKAQAEAQGAKFVVAMAPVGVVDPLYVRFWSPWPRYYSYSIAADARHRRLAGMLAQRGVQIVDLRKDLSGVPGTYRVADGHWTDLGHDIVADRLARSLLALDR